MFILIVTDIFGLTQDMKSFASKLVIQAGDNYKIIDPYNEIEQNFCDEDEAYQAFMDTCGHQSYSQKVIQAIEQLTDETLVIGFSAGASAIWKSIDIKNLTTEIKHQKVKHFVGFYPSQIRNQLDVTPYCDVTLLFPKSEEHFNLEDTLQALSKKSDVYYRKSIYEHGFFNPLSKNFSQTATTYFLVQLVKVIHSLNSNISSDISCDLGEIMTETSTHFLRNVNED